MRKLYQVVFFLILSIQIYSQCCIRFDGKNCIQCPKGTHVFRGNCILDIKDCAAYKDGFDCAMCNLGFQLNSTGDCQPKPASSPSSPILQSTTPKDYNDTMIDPQNLSGVAGDTFMLSDQFLRGMNDNVASARIAGARVRSYTNGTAETTIQYQVGTGNYYRGVLQVDLQSFIMKQISFEKVNTLILNQQTDVPPVVATIVKTEVVNLGNPAHIDKVSLIDASARTQNPKITMIKTGNITTYSDGTFGLSLVYTTTTPGEQVLISGTILQSNTAKINDIKISAATVNVSPNNDALDATPKNPTILSTTYQAMNPQDTTDQNYLICKDFLASQVPQCAGIDPTKVQRLIQGTKNSYILTQTKADGSVWDMYISISTDTFIAKLDKQTQVSAPTKTATASYVKVDNNLIYKDINFLLVDEYINKQSKDKYKNAVIRSVEKMESGGVANYRVLFEVGGFVWEVLGSINTSTFVVSGYKQTKKEALPPATNTNVAANGSKNGTNAGTQTNTSSTTNNTNNSTSGNATKNTTSTSSSSSSSSTNANSNGDTRSLVTNSTNSTSHNTSTSSTSSSTSTSSSSTSSSSTSTNVNTNINTIASSTINNNQNTNTNTNQNTNQNTNTNTNTNTNQNTNNKPVPASLLASLAPGLATLSSDDMNSAEFKEIDSLIRAVNPIELKSPNVIGAFVKTASFTRNYQIYYQTPSQIYEAVISRDQLRRRTYIISFAKIGF